MKRTEMLDIMERELRNFHIAPDTRDCVNQILMYMEHAGMAPPCRPSDEKVIRCQVREWEPEQD